MTATKYRTTGINVMENHGQIAIVIGYRACNYPPSPAHEAGLRNRFAVIFDTTNHERGYAYLDPFRFASVLKIICNVIPHDTLVIERGGNRRIGTLEEMTEDSLALR